MSLATNDWFFALFNPFEAWYAHPHDKELADIAARYFRDQGLIEAAKSVLRRQAAFGPEGTHLMIDDSYVYGDEGLVFIPCTCGSMWPSQEALKDHVRSEFEKANGGEKE